MEAQQSDPSSPAELDAQHDRAAKAVPASSGAATLEFLDPSNRKMLAYLRHVRRTAGSVRGQSLALRTARRSGSVAIRRDDSSRDAGLCGVSRPSQTALPPDAGALRFLLARIACSARIPGNPGRRVGIDADHGGHLGERARRGRALPAGIAWASPNTCRSSAGLEAKPAASVPPGSPIGRSCRIRRPRWCW